MCTRCSLYNPWSIFRRWNPMFYGPIHSLLFVRPMRYISPLTLTNFLHFIHSMLYIHFLLYIHCIFTLPSLPHIYTLRSLYMHPFICTFCYQCTTIRRFWADLEVYINLYDTWCSHIYTLCTKSHVPTYVHARNDDVTSDQFYFGIPIFPTVRTERCMSNVRGWFFT